MPAKAKKTKRRLTYSLPYKQKLSYGQRASDKIAAFGGSWAFILSFIAFIIVWMIINTIILTSNKAFDPFPFILLNLTLSCLAALQAPIILMAQNRQAQRDRAEAHYDFMVNQKAEREIQDVQHDLEEIKEMLKKLTKGKGKKGR